MAEVVIKMIGLGAKSYLAEKINLLDVTTVLLSIVELVFLSEEEGSGGGSFGALRAVRLFRVFKLFKSGDLRILMDSIIFTISMIGNYSILLCLFIYVYALMGMSFFAGSFRFTDDGDGPVAVPDENGVYPPYECPRANFDTIQWSIVTVFQVIIGDDWTTVMYNAIRAKGGLFAFYFITLVMFGNIIMLNLFLAILLGNFDRARDFGQKRKNFLVFKAFYNQDYDLSETLDWMFGDMSVLIKTKILKWDARIIRAEQKNKNKFMRSMLVAGAHWI